MKREHWGLLFLAGMAGVGYYLFKDKKPAAPTQPVVGTGTSTGADIRGEGTNYANANGDMGPSSAQMLDAGATLEYGPPTPAQLLDAGETLTYGPFADTYSKFQ